MVSYDFFVFMLKIETSTRGTTSMPFLVFRRDHLRSGIISDLGFICGWTMDDGRWTMDGGRWTMDDGRWTMDDGRWTMDDGRWTMDDGR